LSTGRVRSVSRTCAKNVSNGSLLTEKAELYWT
jgi:hypothetical protein